MTQSKPQVTLFGLGLMGTGMAGSLLRAGFPLTLYNRTLKRTEPFVAQGARTASTPKEAAAGADVLVSMVADDSASRAVWQGDQGGLAGVRPNAIVIECSTLTVGWVQELAAAARKAGCTLLDAPVTGSRIQAGAGELKFLVGGDEAALECARPVLDAMGKSVVYLGPQGSGALMKLVNNFLCGVQAASLAEAMAVLEKSGLDIQKARDVLENGAPGSPLLKAVFGRMAGRDYDPHFHLALMAKDLTYSIQEGERHGVHLKTVAAALEHFRNAVDQQHGTKDFSAVVEPMRTADGSV